MREKAIQNAVYYRKPTDVERMEGMKAKDKIRILVPIRDVFLGVDELCGAILKPSVMCFDGHRYYFECVNLAETKEGEG